MFQGERQAGQKVPGVGPDGVDESGEAAGDHAVEIVHSRTHQPGLRGLAELADQILADPGGESGDP